MTKGLIWLYFSRKDVFLAYFVFFLIYFLDFSFFAPFVFLLIDEPRGFKHLMFAYRIFILIVYYSITIYSVILIIISISFILNQSFKNQNLIQSELVKSVGILFFFRFYKSIYLPYL